MIAGDSGQVEVGAVGGYFEVGPDFVDHMSHFEELKFEFSDNPSIFFGFLLALIQLFAGVFEIFPQYQDHLILLCDFFFELANSLVVFIVVLFFFLVKSSHDLLQPAFEIGNAELFLSPHTAA